MPKTPLPPCWPCLAEKQTEQHNRSIPQPRASRILEFIHMDLGGYYLLTPSGHRYFLIMVDDFTRYIWIWLLKTKDMKAISSAMTEFIIYAENQFQVKIIRARTDNGTGEFKN